MKLSGALRDCAIAALVFGFAGGCGPDGRREPARAGAIEDIPIPSSAEPQGVPTESPGGDRAGYRVDTMSLTDLVSWYERELPRTWRDWNRCAESPADRGSTFRQWTFARSTRGLLVVAVMQERPQEPAFILISRSDDETC